MARIISIVSGKGGVGRTTISVNLALALAGKGFRTCLFDADLALADIHILFGLYPEYDLKDLVFGQRSLKDILIQHQSGIDIVPGHSGDEKMADLAPEKLEYLTKCLSHMSEPYDFIVVDSASGISRDVVSFCKVSSDIMLLLTSEPASLIDSYSFLNVLRSNGYNGAIWTAFNRVHRSDNAETLFSKFKKTIQDFLDLQIKPLGAIMQDSNVLKASRRQKPCMLYGQNSLFSTCIRDMAQILETRGECATKPFAPFGVKARAIQTLKKKLPGLSSGWRAGKQKEILRSSETGPEPVHENSPRDDNHPSEAEAAVNEASHEDPHRITDEPQSHSETRDPKVENSFCEATLLALDFEAFANGRQTA